MTEIATTADLLVDLDHAFEVADQLTGQILGQELIELAGEPTTGSLADLVVNTDEAGYESPGYESR